MLTLQLQVIIVELAVIVGIMIARVLVELFGELKR